jgi:hypothetical protein
MPTFYCLTWVDEHDGIRRYSGPSRNPREVREGSVLLTTEAPNGHEAQGSDDLVLPEDRGAFSVSGENFGTNACYNARNKARLTAREESLRSWGSGVSVYEHNVDDLDGTPVSTYFKGVSLGARFLGWTGEDLQRWHDDVVDHAASGW